MIRTGCILAAAAGAWWWWTQAKPAPVEVNVVEDLHQYVVPLVGDELIEKLSPDRCLPMVDELVHHPNWSFGINVRSYGCMGHDELGNYEVHADGSVDYTMFGMTRTLQLTEPQLTAFRGIGSLDCTRPEVFSYSSLAITVSPGKPDGDGGARVPGESALGATLMSILDDARASYVRWRVAQLGTLQLHLRTRSNLRVAVVGHSLRITYHRRLRKMRELDDEELVDLLDAIIGDHVEVTDDDEYNMAGTLTVGGLTYPVRMARYANGAALPLRYALDEAEYDR